MGVKHSFPLMLRSSKKNLLLVTKIGKPASKTESFFSPSFSFMIYFYNFTTSYYKALMIGEVTDWKYFEGSGHGLFVVLPWHLPSQSEESHKNLLVQPVARSRFEDGASWTQVYCHTARLSCSMSRVYNNKNKEHFSGKNRNILSQITLSDTEHLKVFRRVMGYLPFLHANTTTE